MLCLSVSWIMYLRMNKDKNPKWPHVKVAVIDIIKIRFSICVKLYLFFCLWDSVIRRFLRFGHRGLGIFCCCYWQHWAWFKICTCALSWYRSDIKKSIGECRQKGLINWSDSFYILRPFFFKHNRCPCHWSCNKVFHITFTDYLLHLEFGRDFTQLWKMNFSFHCIWLW